VRDDQLGFVILAVGLALTAVGSLWLIIRAFRTGLGWGLAVLLLPGVGVIAYALFHFKRAIWPLVVMLLGGLVAASPIAINKLVPPVKEELKNTTPEETDLTVTGLAGYDYASLKTKTDLTVLQMANKEVTDAEVEHLRGLTKLKRLDLTDTAVTDASLAVLATLPLLEDVKLARTKVSDDGVKKFLADAKALKAIDVRGTDVKTATVRDWKNAGPDRTYLK
jgi:hypothetical protein